MAQLIAATRVDGTSQIFDRLFLCTRGICSSFVNIYYIIYKFRSKGLAHKPHVSNAENSQSSIQPVDNGNEEDWAVPDTRHDIHTFPSHSIISINI
jgi:hypothetical protein